MVHQEIVERPVSCLLCVPPDQRWQDRKACHVATRQSPTRPSDTTSRPLRSNAQKAVRKGRSRMRPFPLSIVSNNHGHSKHTEDCFVAHLLDAVRPNNARHDLEQALIKLEAEYANHTSCLSTWNGQKAILARQPFKGLEYSLESLDFNIKKAHENRTKVCADEEVFREDRSIVEAALRQAMQAIEVTALSFCSVPQARTDAGGAQSILPVSKKFAYSLHVIVEKYHQLQAEEIAYKTKTHDFLKCDDGVAKSKLRRAYTEAQRSLQLAKEQYATRLHNTLSNEVATALGDRIKTRHELLRCNFQQMPPKPTAWEWTCELPLQPDRDIEGRPTYFDAAADVPLAVKNFHNLKRQKGIAKTELKEARLEYLRGFEQWLTAYPGSSQSEWDDVRRGAKMPEFHAAEAVLIEKLGAAEEDHIEARKKMWEFIDNEPQFSIASCSRCTSDYNAETNGLDEAVLPKLTAARASRLVPAGLVRQWQYPIVMMTVPGHPDDVAHSDVSGVVSLEPAVDLDTVSNGCGLDRDAESSARKQKWLERYRKIVDEGRQKLEEDMRELEREARTVIV